MSISLIETAHAAPAAAAQPGMGSLLIPLVLMVVIFYFLLWRPQSKRMKEHRELMNNLNTGDEVVTSGGLAGKITHIGDSFISIEIAPNTKIKCQKQAISTVLPKGTLEASE